MKYSRFWQGLLALLLLFSLCEVSLAADLTPVFRIYSASRYSFSNPSGVAVDGSGNIYVADTGNNRIQKLTGDSAKQWGGTAGSGNQQFNFPWGVAVNDPAGLVYVADMLNNRIQKLTTSGAYMATFANSSDSFYLPKGVAVDGAGNVYVADTNNNRIQKFDSNGVLLGQWGKANNNPGTGAGEFSNPNGVAVDLMGTIYVADTGNKRIQKFMTRGAIWSDLVTNLDQPRGIAVDGTGNVYVAVYPLNNLGGPGGSVRKYDSGGVFMGQWGEQGGVTFNWPKGVAVDRWGYVYVADSGNNSIVVVYPSPRNLTVDQDAQAGGNVTFGVHGQVVVTCPSSCGVLFTPGDEITLDVVANPYYSFVGWAGDCSSCVGPSCTITQRITDTYCTALFDPYPFLYFTIDGTGAGTVNNIKPGSLPFTCSVDKSPCITTFPPGTMFSLAATATGESQFTGWGGGICDGTGTCDFTLTTPLYLIASFSPVKPARVTVKSVVTEYDFLTDAYKDVPDGGTIQAREHLFLENLGLTLGKKVTIKGGYNLTYTSQGSSHSTIKGILTVGTGSLTVDRLAIQ
jgi:DNA-binding beta-propeller fold protein YncE